MIVTVILSVFRDSFLTCQLEHINCPSVMHVVCVIFPLLPAGLVDGILNLALLTWVSVLASPLNQLHIYPP